MVKTNRNMWVLILLSLVTFGIYPLFYWAGVGEDVNKMCAADGKTTQNFWIAWLLGLITAGVFQLVWIYGVVERIYDAGKRYGVGDQMHRLDLSHLGAGRFPAVRRGSVHRAL